LDLYVSPVGNVIAAYQYADDTQLYMAVRPNASLTFKAVSDCVDDVSRWFLEKGLQLNQSKTETALFDTRAQRQKISTAGGVD